MEKQHSFYIVRHGSAKSAFELRESEIPAKQDGHIRVETEGFGINFADIMARKGLYQDAPQHHVWSVTSLLAEPWMIPP